MIFLKPCKFFVCTQKIPFQVKNQDPQVAYLPWIRKDNDDNRNI